MLACARRLLHVSTLALRSAHSTTMASIVNGAAVATATVDKRPEPSVLANSLLPRSAKRARVSGPSEDDSSSVAAGPVVRAVPVTDGSPSTASGGESDVAPSTDSKSRAAVSPTPTTVMLSWSADMPVPNSERVVAEVVERLRRGEVVGLPTDTIYGIGCLAQDTSAVNRVYAIKGRDETKPIAICVSEIDQVEEYGDVTVPNELLQELLPGPVTLCFKRTAKLNPSLNPTSQTIGIRIPDDALIRAVAKGCGEAIALTSANRSGERSSLEVGDFQAIWGDLGCVVNSGRRGESRLGSTVVDLSQPLTYFVLRAGDSAKETIACLHRHGLVERRS